MRKHKIPPGFFQTLLIGIAFIWPFVFVLPWLVPFIAIFFAVLLVKIWKGKITIDPNSC